MATRHFFNQCHEYCDENVESSNGYRSAVDPSWDYTPKTICYLVIFYKNLGNL